MHDVRAAVGVDPEIAAPRPALSTGIRGRRVERRKESARNGRRRLGIDGDLNAGAQGGRGRPGRRSDGGPASLPGADGAFQRACWGPKVWTKVGSRWFVVLNVSTTVAGVEQPVHGVLRKTWLSEFESASWIADAPCGSPRIGATVAEPKLPMRTSMSKPCVGRPGP